MIRVKSQIKRTGLNLAAIALCGLIATACSSRQPALDRTVMAEDDVIIVNDSVRINMSQMPRQEGVYDDGISPYSSTPTPILEPYSSAGVQVYSLDGPSVNPFDLRQKRRTILQNTTTSGYTELNQNIRVYPVNGEKSAFFENIPENLRAEPDLPPIKESQKTLPQQTRFRPMMTDYGMKPIVESSDGAPMRLTQDDAVKTEPSKERRVSSPPKMTEF